MDFNMFYIILMVNMSISEVSGEKQELVRIGPLFNKRYPAGHNIQNPVNLIVSGCSRISGVQISGQYHVRSVSNSF